MRPRSRSRRAMRFEPLEARRLLVAEGDLFSLSKTVDATGLLGTVSAQVQWGDGTQTSGEVSAQPASGRLKIRLDYSLDTSGFFAGANLSRRTILQEAADALVRRFNDDLQAITPGGKLQWNAQFINPANGRTTLNPDGTVNVSVAKNLSVGSNELVVFVAARDLSGNERGRGGPGGYYLPPVQPSTIAEQQQILAFWDTVQFRGETGAKATTPTDFGPWGGSIAFDTLGTNWYFGRDADGAQDGQTDFVSVAMHELAHVLGFGRAGINKSWDTFAVNDQFTGVKAKAAYVGVGNVPLDQSYHWGDSLLTQDNQPTLMRENLSQGERQPVTPLDVAALDDIGWTLLGSTLTVTANHVYADNGAFPTKIILRGSKLGEVVIPATTATVTNVAPTLTVPTDQSVVAGVALSLTNIGSLSDPGFNQSASTPPTSETFTYTINWGDGSDIVAGDATIDQTGNATRDTLASFNGTHAYTETGIYTVTVRVSDDDGGSDQETFRVTVAAPPKLELSLNQSSIVENEGTDAATLTVRRSGPASDKSLTVTLRSNDTSEATLPATAVITAGATSVSVPVDAVDDALLDGSQSLTLAAAATGVDPGNVELTVTDYETIDAIFSSPQVLENDAESVKLTLSRSNTNTNSALTVNATGGNTEQLGFSADFVIPAGKQSVVLDVLPVNDNDPEPMQSYAYAFTATGYLNDQASIDLLDDEPPFYQNQEMPLDVDSSGDFSAFDALAVINELTDRIAVVLLNPKTEPIENDFYYDVNGDYFITALDALLVINALGEPQANAEQIDPKQVGMIPMTSIAQNEEDSELSLIQAEQSVTLF
ncbi:dockerin type I domain-containing protein [Planctomycetes bacterium CA13]